MGSPVDDYDFVCHELSHCKRSAHKCTNGGCFSETQNTGFEFTWNTDDKSHGCFGTNACDEALCQCDLLFAYDIYMLLEASQKSMTVDLNNLLYPSGEYLTTCVAGSGTGNGASSQC